MNPKRTVLIIFSHDQFNLLYKYLIDCDFSAFKGHNDYTRINEPREFFYRWHLNVIIKKLNRARAARAVFLTINLAELKTIEAIVKRVDCCQYTRQVLSIFTAKSKKYIHLPQKLNV